MKTSQLFTKTRKDAPADEVSKNAQLLIRAGYIYKEMAGVYTMLPLGLIVLNKIEQIIREEMNAIGGQEMLLTTLQQSSSWEASGRWDDKVMDVWFRTKLSNGTELGLAPTHEEPLTDIMKNHITSYKDLPKYVYQFQTKFRNELRSKSGLMRGREFLMKDLYSFCRDKAEHDKFYEICAEAYHKIYDRLGIGDITYRTFASGGSFSKYSDEFQTLSPVGEDTVYVHEAKKLAINSEVFSDEVLKDLGLDKKDLVEKKAVEVGNIFTLGAKYSEALDLKYVAEDGSEKLVFMGSYGIGPSRVMGLLAEHFADENGLAWPMTVAPYQVYLVAVGESEEVKNASNKLYEELSEKGIEVLYDDRDVRPGEKFADADLLGIPVRLVVSDKTLANESVELKNRTSKEVSIVKITEIADLLYKYIN
jgi:prolyl-tRNA synthetase